MNAPFILRPDLSEASWPLRWKSCRGTRYEDKCLLSIAVEAELAGDGDIAACASDAVNFPDDRRDMIAELERLFRVAAAAEDEADRAYRYEVQTGREWPRPHGSYVPAGAA